jgi:hypothetical protein
MLLCMLSQWWVCFFGFVLIVTSIVGVCLVMNCALCRFREGSIILCSAAFRLDFSLQYAWCLRMCDCLALGCTARSFLLRRWKTPVETAAHMPETRFHASLHVVTCLSFLALFFSLLHSSILLPCSANLYANGDGMSAFAPLQATDACSVLDCQRGGCLRDDPIIRL